MPRLMDQAGSATGSRHPPPGNGLTVEATLTHATGTAAPEATLTLYGRRKTTDVFRSLPSEKKPGGRACHSKGGVPGGGVRIGFASQEWGGVVRSTKGGGTNRHA